MAELRVILHEQITHPTNFINGGQLLCHTPGNLLHFPLGLDVVSVWRGGGGGGRGEGGEGKKWIWILVVIEADVT